jgi:hypothetical protein
VNRSDPRLKRLRRAARTTALRLRLDEAVRRGATWLLAPLLYAVAALTFVKVARPGPEVETWLMRGLAVPAAVVLGVVVHALLRRRPWFFGALALDRHHGLHDRVANALSFGDVKRPSPLMAAAIDDAVQALPRLSPRRAAPVHFPKDLVLSVALGAAVYGISLLEVQTRRFVPEPKKDFEALVVAADDLEVFREVTSDLQGSDDAGMQDAVRKFNQLVEDLADQRVDRREVFRRLEEIESGLLSAADADQEAVEKSLREMGAELAKSHAGKETGEALEENRLEDAEDAMRKLADRLDKREKVNKKRLEELRKSLEAASRTTTKHQEATDAERSELQERRKRLLKKKEKEGLTPKEAEELRKTERRLERLDRRKRQDRAARKELSQLDKDLAKAARDLMKELGDAAKSLRQGAQDLNRTAQKQMTRKQKQELKRRLERMRELLRQQGQGGKKRMQQLQRFAQRARGGRKGPQQPGQGGQGKDGKGRGQGSRPMLTLQPGSPGGDGPSAVMPGGDLPMPGAGGEREGSGAGSGSAGEKWGNGHDPNVAGEETRLAGETHDVAAAAQDTGQGPSPSEVIYGAADRGFVGRGYEQVFTDYETVAEELLSRDEIPPGYEFYVRRYFQLIRPRE